jgi:hypothetical protein
MMKYRLGELDVKRNNGLETLAQAAHKPTPTGVKTITKYEQSSW